MFAVLSLPLCDDGQAIKSAADAQRSARNRELNSTKGTVAAKAQAWFEQVDALLKKREQLLGAAYQDFVALGDAVLAAAGFGGKRKIARGGRTALFDLAQSWCGARDDLAQFWVEKFMAERKLGSPLVGVGARSQVSRQQRAVPQRQAVPASPEHPKPPAKKSKTRRAAATPVVSTVPRKQTRGGGSPAPTRGTGKARTMAAASVRSNATSPGDQPRQRGRMVAMGVSALAVAAVLGSASQGLIPLDFGNSSSAAATSETGGDEAAQRSLAPSWDDALKPTLATQTSQAEAPLIGEGEDTPDKPKGFSNNAPADLATEAAPGQVARQALKPPSTVRSRTEPAAPLSPWTAWAIEPPKLAFAGQSLLLRLECDSLPDGRLHSLRLQGLKVREIELNAARTQVHFEVMPLPEGYSAGQASWAFTLKDDSGKLSQEIQGSCQILLPPR